MPTMLRSVSKPEGVRAIIFGALTLPARIGFKWLWAVNCVRKEATLGLLGIASGSCTEGYTEPDVLASSSLVPDHPLPVKSLQSP